MATAANLWAGAELAARRVKAGYTQARLAELAKIDRSRYNGLERGTQKITETYAARLAPHLGIKDHRRLLPPAEPVKAIRERSPLDLLRGLVTTVEKQQETIDGLVKRMEALERGGEGTQRQRKAR